MCMLINSKFHFYTYIWPITSTLPWQEGGGAGLFSSLRGSTICTGIDNDVYNSYMTRNGAAWGGKGGGNGEKWQSEREGERLSLTWISRPSPCKMCMKRGYNSHNKRSGRPPEVPVVVRIAIKENMLSGEGLLTLGDPWHQSIRFLWFLGLIIE